MTPDVPPSHTAGPADPASTDRHDLPRDFLFPALRSEPESFPVLKAFQEYLEEERERARKRLVIVSVLAISALVLVVLVFLAVGTSVIGSLTRRNDQLQEIVLRAAVRDLSAPNAASATREAVPAPELARIEAPLQRLQAENAALQNRWGALQDLPPPWPASVDTTLSNLSTRAAPSPPRHAPRRCHRPHRRPCPARESARCRFQTPPPPVDLPAATPLPPKAPQPAAAPPPDAAQATPPLAAATAQPATALTPRPRASDPNARVVLNIPAGTRNPPRIYGHLPAQLMLVTDRGVRIPWRILLPDPE